jgi:mannose-6-phosphate isomerase-like protein (cupin superfamily)
MWLSLLKNNETSIIILLNILILRDTRKKKEDKQLLKIVNFEKAVLKVKRLAENRIAKGESADEFVEIGNADGFKIYVTAGKTLKDKSPEVLHENARDVFMLVLQGEIEFRFENGEKAVVKANECFVLPKHVKHSCVFKKMTVAVEGVYEKGLYDG